MSLILSQWVKVGEDQTVKKETAKKKKYWRQVGLCLSAFFFSELDLKSMDF